MPNKNQARGKGAESRIAKALSAQTGLQFIRTPGSGSGNAWKIFSGKKVRGDITCLEPNFEFPFMIESKKSKSFKLDLLFGEDGSADFIQWWEKTLTDARLDGKYPMLVVSRNQGPMICFCLRKDWLRCGLGDTNIMGTYDNLVVGEVTHFAICFDRIKSQFYTKGEANATKS